ncbi:Hypothetical protein A7982_04511 [Minicystis rosea]|nr:Hypothetical protein A7982_04511 [Minicystis rosea]
MPSAPVATAHPPAIEATGTHAPASSATAAPQQPPRAGAPSAPASTPCFGSGAGRITEVAWAPAGARLAVLCGNVEIVDVPSLAVVARAPAGAWTGLGGFRRDGGAMVLSGPSGPVIWDVARGTAAPIPDLPADAANFALSGGFDRVAWSDDGGTVTVRDPARGTTLAVLHPAHDTYGVDLALSDDGELLAVVGQALTIHRAATGAKVAVWSPPRGSRMLDKPRWTADGAFVFFRTAVVDASGLLSPGPGVPTFYGNPVEDQARHQVRRLRLSTRALAESWPAAELAISPDGRMLATSGSCAVTRVDLPFGATKELYRGHESECIYTYAQLGVSADRRFVSGSLSTMSGKSVTVFDASTGEAASWLP